MERWKGWIGGGETLRWGKDANRVKMPIGDYSRNLIYFRVE